MTTLVTLENAGKTYGSGQVAVHALRNVSLSIAPGEFTVFSGPWHFLPFFRAFAAV